MNYKKVIPLNISQGMSMMDSYVVMVADVDTMRGVPVRIGADAARAILSVNDDGSRKQRDLYTLLTDVMEQYDLVLREVRIDSLVDGIYNTTALFSDGFNERRVRCEAGDGIAMVVLTGCDMMIEQSVIQDAGCDINALRDNLPKHHIDDEEGDEDLEELQRILEEYEEREEYEKAAEIQERINKLINGEENNDIES